MFEFPEDGAFIKEGRYYTLEAASLSLSQRREKKEKNEGQKGRWINSREERERKGGFTLSLTPGYSPRRIPWYPSPLTTAISSRLIRLLSLFVPRNSPLSFPSLSPWDVSTAASISLVEQSRTDLFLGWTNRPALTSRQLLSPRFNFSSNGYAIRKGGGREDCATRFDEKKRNPWGRWANFRRFIHLSRYRLSAGGCWSKCWLLCGEGRKNVVFSFFSFFF